MATSPAEQRDQELHLDDHEVSARARPDDAALVGDAVRQDVEAARPCGERLFELTP
jgi:hypothetical protein